MSKKPDRALGSRSAASPPPSSRITPRSDLHQAAMNATGKLHIHGSLIPDPPLIVTRRSGRSRGETARGIRLLRPAHDTGAPTSCSAIRSDDELPSLWDALVKLIPVFSASAPSARTSSTCLPITSLSRMAKRTPVNRSSTSRYAIRPGAHRCAAAPPRRRAPRTCRRGRDPDPGG
jgi:hypothetical protein